MLEGLEDHDAEDFVAFVATGARGTGQYRCAGCGYGITIHADLPDCPMCGGNSWEETAWSPISNAATTTPPHPAASL
jgi:rubrerythrin